MTVNEVNDFVMKNQALAENEITEKLFAESVGRGCRDNVTIIVINLDGRWDKIKESGKVGLGLVNSKIIKKSKKSSLILNSFGEGKEGKEMSVNMSTGSVNCGKDVSFTIESSDIMSEHSIDFPNTNMEKENSLLRHDMSIDDIFTNIDQTKIPIPPSSARHADKTLTFAF
jgi:hypothetical protein